MLCHLCISFQDSKGSLQDMLQKGATGSNSVENDRSTLTSRGMIAIQRLNMYHKSLSGPSHIAIILFSSKEQYMLRVGRKDKLNCLQVINTHLKYPSTIHVTFSYPT